MTVTCFTAAIHIRYSTFRSGQETGEQVYYKSYTNDPHLMKYRDNIAHELNGVSSTSQFYRDGYDLAEA